MGLKSSLVITDQGLEYFERLYAGYRKMYEAPAESSPKFIVDTPRRPLASVAEMLDDPLLMLRDELDALRPHLRLRDDMVPTVRVQLGPAQVAAAFGCHMHVFEDSFPVSSGPLVRSAADVRRMRKPSLDAGMYGEVREFTEIWLENLPPGVSIQHPDIQGPFSNAHLVRGDGIFAEGRSDPVAVDALLDLVTDYMVDVTRWFNGMISSDTHWFFDRGALFRGQAGISNPALSGGPDDGSTELAARLSSPKSEVRTATRMMSADFYAEHVLLRDMRFMRAVGGGCVHYAGDASEIIGHILPNPDVSGLGFDSRHQDLWRLAEAAPEEKTLLTEIGRDSNTYGRLVAGDWPLKRNIVFHLSAQSEDEGREMLQKLRKSVPGGV